MPHVPYSGEPNGKSWGIRLVREMPTRITKKREKTVDGRGRPARGEERIITRGKGRRRGGEEV